MRFGIRIALLAITTAIAAPAFPARSATKSCIQASQALPATGKVEDSDGGAAETKLEILAETARQ